MRTFKLLLAALVLAHLAALGPLQAQDRAATSLTDAVVRISSHGASATEIYTTQGRTLLLGCGHAYQGQDRFKRMTLDIPCRAPGPVLKVGIQLLAVDYEADLSLVQLNAGPVDAYAAVAPAGFVPRRGPLSGGVGQKPLPRTIRPVPQHRRTLGDNLTLASA